MKKIAFSAVGFFLMSCLMVLFVTTGHSTWASESCDEPLANKQKSIELPSTFKRSINSPENEVSFSRGNNGLVLILNHSPTPKAQVFSFIENRELYSIKKNFTTLNFSNDGKWFYAQSIVNDNIGLNIVTELYESQTGTLAQVLSTDAIGSHPYVRFSPDFSGFLLYYPDRAVFMRFDSQKIAWVHPCKRGDTAFSSKELNALFLFGESESDKELSQGTAVLSLLDVRTGKVIWSKTEATVSSAIFSPDDRELLIGQYSGVIQIRSSQSYELLLQPETRNTEYPGVDHFYFFNYTQDGKRFFVSSTHAYSSDASGYDRATGALLFTLPLETRFNALANSDTVLVTVDLRGTSSDIIESIPLYTLQFWSASTGTPLSTLPVGEALYSMDPAGGFVLSPDLKWLAVQMHDKIKVVSSGI